MKQDQDRVRQLTIASILGIVAAHVGIFIVNETSKNTDTGFIVTISNSTMGLANFVRAIGGAALAVVIFPQIATSVPMMHRVGFVLLVPLVSVITLVSWYHDMPLEFRGALVTTTLLPIAVVVAHMLSVKRRRSSSEWD
jgi:hypothetical protein